ncbi:Predicted arabinose efflux permease, MFS family [Stigmatella aurantiaca]|uniref:Predicted arabinose efflux permease, MFS family n=1 Tax=Stigmatella aurantiaca TaxID=41 RepID=A0A1H8AFU4_STIAU|nr:myxochelin export MFS transporter MxcK [Stigmatella aurantiaca]SEM68794.1 Predicted arabinose efflux permease, MFS family [Stigmatella aurantiaca]
MSASPPPASERRLLWLLAAVQFSHLVDFMIIMPLGPEFMRLFGISASQFGVLVSAYTLASAAMGLLGVLWLDRFDRKRTLLGLFAGFIAATLMCGAAQSHLALLLARTVAGACAGLMGAVIMAIIGDVVPPERRGSAIGTVMSALGLSAVVGVPLGLGVANLWGWRMPFWSLGVFAGAVWLGLWRALPALNGHLSASPGQSPGTSLLSIWTPKLALGWLLTFSVVISSFLLIPYLSPYMVGNLGVSASQLPLVYLGGGAATLLCTRWIGRMTDRHGPVRVLASLLVGTMVPHLLFTHLPPSPFPVVALVFALFMSLTSSRVIPTIALIASRVPPAVRGRYLAVNMAASDGASGIAAWVSGLMISTAPSGALEGFGQTGWIAVGVSTLTLCILWTLGRSTARLSAAPT